MDPEAKGQLYHVGARFKVCTLSFLIVDGVGIADSVGKFFAIAKPHNGNNRHCELFGNYQ